MNLSFATQSGAGQFLLRSPPFQIRAASVSDRVTADAPLFRNLQNRLLQYRTVADALPTYFLGLDGAATRSDVGRVETSISPSPSFPRVSSSLPFLPSCMSERR